MYWYLIVWNLDKSHSVVKMKFQSEDEARRILSMMQFEYEDYSAGIYYGIEKEGLSGKLVVIMEYTNKLGRHTIRENYHPKIYG